MPRRRSRQVTVRYATLGLEFSMFFGLMLTMGLGVDYWLNTHPGFTLMGGLVGFALGLRYLIRRARDMQRQQQQQPQGRLP